MHTNEAFLWQMGFQKILTLLGNFLQHHRSSSPRSISDSLVLPTPNTGLRGRDVILPRRSGPPPRVLGLVLHATSGKSVCGFILPGSFQSQSSHPHELCIQTQR